MKIIQLSQNKQALIDDDDFEKVSQFKWHYRNGYATANVYIDDKRTALSMHRLIINAPPKMDVDHINLNKLDNRKENLRICTRAQNMWNTVKPKTNTSGFKGVSFHKSRHKWQAYITINYKRIYLGRFDTAEAAHEVYKEASRKYHGEFGRTA